MNLLVGVFYTTRSLLGATGAHAPWWLTFALGMFAICLAISLALAWKLHRKACVVLALLLLIQAPIVSFSGFTYSVLFGPTVVLFIGEAPYRVVAGFQASMRIAWGNTGWTGTETLGLNLLALFSVSLVLIAAARFRSAREKEE